MNIQRSRSSSPSKRSTEMRTPLQSKDVNVLTRTSSSKSKNILHGKSINTNSNGTNSRERSISRSPIKRNSIYNNITHSTSTSSLPDPMSLSLSAQRSLHSNARPLSGNAYGNDSGSEKSPVLSSFSIPNLPSSESPSSIASLSSNKESPCKRPFSKGSNTGISNSNSNTLTFKIFEDPPSDSPRSSELVSNFRNVKIGKMDILQEQDENMDIYNSRKFMSPSKEDRYKNAARRAVNSRNRTPLGDLDIRLFPGFIQTHDNHSNSDTTLQPKHQLHTSWMLKFNNEQGSENDASIDSVLKVPSYITPPKQRTHFKYVASLNENEKSPSKKTSAVPKKRTNSIGSSEELDLKSAKKSLNFKVFDDKLDQ